MRRRGKRHSAKFEVEAKQKPGSDERTKNNAQPALAESAFAFLLRNPETGELDGMD